VVVKLSILLLIESLESLKDNTTLKFPRPLLDLLDDTTAVYWHVFILFLLPVTGLLFILKAINVLRE
jgi:hypothetical protein